MAVVKAIIRINVVLQGIGDIRTGRFIPLSNRRCSYIWIGWERRDDPEYGPLIAFRCGLLAGHSSAHECFIWRKGRGEVYYPQSQNALMNYYRRGKQSIKQKYTR